MAVKLRLTRIGKKKQPFYRIVATDSRVRRNGKYIERIGYYNPLTHPAEIVINEEKAFYWLKKGAIPTEAVKSLFSKKGIILKWHFMKSGHNEAKIEEEYKKWELLQLEKQKREEALAAQAKQEQKQEEPAKESVNESKEGSLPEEKEVSVAPQSEEQVSDQELEESQPKDQMSDHKDTDEPDESSDK